MLSGSDDQWEWQMGIFITWLFMEWFDWLQSLVKVVSTHFTFLLYCLTDQNICKIAPASQTGERVKQTFQFFTIFIVANLSLIVVVIVSLLFCIKNSTNIVLSVLDVENCNAFMWMQTPKLYRDCTPGYQTYFFCSVRKFPEVGGVSGGLTFILYCGESEQGRLSVSYRLINPG